MKHSWTLFAIGVLTLALTLAGAAQGASTFYAIGGGVSKSTDGGLTWKTTIVRSNDPKLLGVASLRGIIVDPQNPSNVYLAAGFGGASAILKSADAGQTWSSIPQPALSFSVGPGSLAIDPVRTNVVYAATFDRTFAVSTDAGVTWRQPMIPKPAGAPGGANADQPQIASVATDPNRSGVVYAVGPNSIGQTDKGYVLVSTDYGNTWSTLAQGQAFAGRVFVDPKNSQVLYGSNVNATFASGSATGSCPTTNGGTCALYKSSDGGKSWTELNFPSRGVHSLAFDITPGVVYASANTGVQDANVWKSADGGNTWAVVLADPFAVITGGFGAAVRADPSTASTVYTVGNGMFFKSTDAGAHWTTSPLSDTHVDLVLVPPPPAASPPPAISANGVVNAAGFQPGIVPSSWVTILGNNLAPKTDDWSNSIVNGALPTSLDGVSVSMGGKAAFVYYISPGQLNVLAPDVPAGPVTVTVTTPGGTGAGFATTASPYGPAFFLWPGSQVVATRQDFSPAAKAGTFSGATTVPAKPGDVLILWATGFGPTNPVAPAGVAVPGDKAYATATAPIVTVNNTPATVFGAALAPGAAGLYQIAIQVPGTLADGDWPVQANIGGVLSPAGTILSVHR